MAADATPDRPWGDDAAPLDSAVLAKVKARLEAEQERGETVDFYFAGEAIADGAEVGRFRRNDHCRVPDGLKIQGDLRLVLWEPGLTDQDIGGPAVSVLTAEFIDEVEAVCTYVSGSRRRVSESLKLGPAPLEECVIPPPAGHMESNSHADDRALTICEIGGATAGVQGGNGIVRS